MSLNLPNISFVVIGHNEESKIEECLRSILRADYPEEKKDLIYVDNNSSDRSLERAADFPIRTVALKKEPPHPGVARNAGLRIATGEFVQFIDADMALDPAWLRNALPHFENPRVACVVGRLREQRPEASAYNSALDFSWRLKELGEVESPSGGGLFRRRVLQRLGGYDESLRAGEEIELGYRLREAGYAIYSTEARMATHDADIRTFRQFWKRSLRDGYAEMRVIQKYFRGSDGLPQGYILKMDAQVGLFALLGTTSVALQQWNDALALVTVPFLFAAGKALRLVRRTGLWKQSLLYSGLLYLSFVPLVIGQGRCLWDRIHSKGR
jgi:glycosyltransferase involved in cell wall biosynthesis